MYEFNKNIERIKNTNHAAPGAFGHHLQVLRPAQVCCKSILAIKMSHVFNKGSSLVFVGLYSDHKQLMAIAFHCHYTNLGKPS